MKLWSVRASRGLSVAEIMVAMAVFGIVMSGIAQIMRHTTRFYNTHIMAIDVQQQVLQASRWISQDMSEGSYKSLRSLGTNAVTFGSPRNLDGRLAFDGEVMLWQKFVCYHADQYNGAFVLKRQELYFDDPAHAAPPVPDTITLSTFREPGIQQRIVARYIESLKVTVDDSASIEMKANLDDGAFTLKLTTKVEMAN